MKLVVYALTSIGLILIAATPVFSPSAEVLASPIQYTEMHNYGNLSIVYVVKWYNINKIININNCIYFIINLNNSSSIRYPYNASGPSLDYILGRWSTEYINGQWPSIERELRSANYSGYLNFYYKSLNETYPEALARASPDAFKMLELGYQIKSILKKNNITTSDDIYVDIHRGFLSITIFTDIGNGFKELTHVKHVLANISRLNTPRSLAIVEISETPFPARYNVSELVKLKQIILDIYREAGIPYDPSYLYTGIDGRGGLIMSGLLAPPNATEFLAQLTERSRQALGTCPNGSLVYFSRKIEVVYPAGYRISWRYAVLELAGLAMIIAGSAYLVIKALRERRAA